jgi:predicted TIM-barrel fold metal-dependent hydrolase
LRLLLAGTTSDAAALLKTTPSGTSLFFDTALASDTHGLRRLMDQVPADRVVYGSAAPLNDAASSVRAIRESGLSSEQSKAIGGENAKRFLRPQ